MGFAWFHAEGRRHRRTPTLLTGADPSERSPPDEVNTVTVPLLGRTPDVLPLTWLALLPSGSPAETVPLSERRPTSGVSPPRVRCSPAALPRPARPLLPWAFLDFELSLVAFIGDEGHQVLSNPFDSRPKPGLSRPRTHRGESVAPTNSSPSSLLATALAVETAVAMTQGLKTVHLVSQMLPRCRNIALALQPSWAHRCRCAR